MILRSIVIENLRSYQDETRINFPTGTSLFEGDIASGKSTILYAVEFALFGLGSLTSSFLLRNGERRGRVTLFFEEGGEEYEVNRSLVRSESGVQQGECYITGPEGKIKLSPSELKERVLQILRYNEPTNPRAQSVIYRYAIFTPQEEMKEVISKDADDRLQTLRRAFGIEEYKVATENSSLIISRLRERISILQGALQEFEGLKEKKAMESRRLQRLKDDLKPLREREKELEIELKKWKDELRGLEESRNKIGKAEERLPLLRAQLKDKSSLCTKLLRENERLRKKIDDDIGRRIAHLEALREPTEKTKDQLKKELERLQSEANESKSSKAKVEERIENFDEISEKNICPVCEQEIEPKGFAEKLHHLKQEKSKLERVINRLDEGLGKTADLLEKLADYQNAEKELMPLKAQLREEKERVEENEKTVEILGAEINEINARILVGEEEIKPLQKVMQQIRELEEKILEVEGRHTGVGKRIAAIEESLRELEDSLKLMEEQVALKEKQSRAKDLLSEHKIWFSDYLTPTIQVIEQYVMTALNQRFNAEFQRWFQMIMQDSELQVRVDESFSPLMERDGYEQDYLTLSGGERTSVALAYRLALNKLVQEVATGGEASLLILDEPTDGFSKEQLSKIRDILAELNSPQVILVSHERELEGFADHVFRVEKLNGTSRVTLKN